MDFGMEPYSTFSRNDCLYKVILVAKTTAASRRVDGWLPFSEAGGPHAGEEIAKQCRAAQSLRVDRGVCFWRLTPFCSCFTSQKDTTKFLGPLF